MGPDDIGEGVGKNLNMENMMARGYTDMEVTIFCKLGRAGLFDLWI